MFSSAPSVSVGATPPLGVAAANSGAHPVVPSEFTHDAIASASAYSLPVSTDRVAGSDAAWPVVVFASSPAFRNAFAIPLLFVALAPTWSYAVINGASAYAAATVETSFT